jgi:hypothetical protein
MIISCAALVLVVIAAGVMWVLNSKEPVGSTLTASKENWKEDYAVFRKLLRETIETKDSKHSKAEEELVLPVGEVHWDAEFQKMSIGTTQIFFNIGTSADEPTSAKATPIGVVFSSSLADVPLWLLIREGKKIQFTGTFDGKLGGTLEDGKMRSYFATISDVRPDSPSLLDLPEAQLAEARVLGSWLQANAVVLNRGDAIPEMANVDHLDVALKLLERDHFDLKEKALAYLAQAGPRAQTAVPSLAQALSDEKLTSNVVAGPSFTHKVLNVLAGLGTMAEPAVPAIVDALNRLPASDFVAHEAGSAQASTNRSLAKHYVATLQSIGAGDIKAGTPRILEYVLYTGRDVSHGSYDDYRKHCAPIVEFVKERDTDTAIELLAGKLKKDQLEEFERTTILYVLGEFGSKSVPILAAELNRRSGKRQIQRYRTIATQLRKLGPEARAAVPALIQALQETYQGDLDRVPYLLIDVLTAIGPDASDALPILRELETNPATNKEAAKAIEIIRGAPCAI